MSSPWLTANQAAEYLQVHPRTIIQWARTGRLKGHILSGCQRLTWRFLRSDLDATMMPPSGCLGRRTQ